MVLDTLSNSDRYTSQAGFRKAFAFLARPDLADLPAGRHEIDGDRIYAICSKGPGRKRSEGKLETHQRYIDIQYVISGKDEMGWRPAATCTRPAGPYDADKDIRFFDDEPDSWITVNPGAFTVFYPSDAHLPLISDREIHKIIIKIEV
ncbi:MAG: YhcH/YjgK/YiaL family protein [Nitrospirota bacterium]|nr:YhcH/YjgK/YiaL family protein [Nitrospirota bacterium]